MATNPDGVKTRKGKEGDTYYENTALAGRLKGKGVNVKAGPVSSDRTQRKATNVAKRKEYAAKRGNATPTKRTAAGGPNQSSQPVSRPTTPPAQTFAQNGQQLPPRQVGQYGPVQGPMGPGGQMPTNYGPPAQPQYNPFRQVQMPPSYQPQGMQMGQPLNQPYSPGLPYGDQVQMNNIAPRPSAFGPQMPPPQQQNPWGRRW